MLMLGMLMGSCLLPEGMAVADGTHAPVIYTIDYTDSYFTDPAFIEQFADAPPDVVHVGKAVPITHNWGPVPILAGENQYTGGPGHTLSWENIRLLSPDEVRERIRVIEEGVARLHEIGVPTVMPYISLQSIAGDHEKREGFWKFYDNWDTYAEWLGPKPPDDPLNWLAVGKDGKFLPGLCGGYSPDYFAPLHRYRVCPLNPHWRDFQLALVRLIAHCGYDGVFVDNTHHGGEYCDTCQQAFREFVAQSFTPRQLRALGTAVADPAEITLGDEGTPAELVRRFNMVVCRDRMALLRDEGRKIDPDFVTFPNAGQLDSCLVVGDGCDLYMFESTSSPGTTAQGPVPPDRRATITVAQDAPQAEPVTLAHTVQYAETFIEMQVEISFVPTCRPGEQQALSVKVLQVGASNQDADAAEDVRLVLEGPEDGEKTELPLEPRVNIGGGAAVADTVRPPVELKARWTPEAAGRYRLSLAYTYTDDEHLEATKRRPQVDPLMWDEVYQTHIAALSCAGLSKARTILLDYESKRTGRENIQELGHAEAAAFGNGAAIASAGQPQKKYRRFFDAHRDLYENLHPYPGAQTVILYALWGGNPGSMRGASSAPVLADVLSEEHQLFSGMLDRDIPADGLAPYTTICLGSRHYELTPAQLGALRACVRNGARLLVTAAGVAIDGRPLERVFGQSQVERWDPDQTPRLSEPIAPSDGPLRGVRFAAYSRTGPPEVLPFHGEIVLHAVNYNVALVGEPGRVAKLGDLPIDLPLPQGWQAKTVRCYDPDAPADAPPEQITHSQKGSRLHFVLPSLRIYKVIQILAS